MAEAAKASTRITWREWLDGRDAKRKVLDAKGLGAPCRRTTARPETLATAKSIETARRAALPQ